MSRKLACDQGTQRSCSREGPIITVIVWSLNKNSGQSFLEKKQELVSPVHRQLTAVRSSKSTRRATEPFPGFPGKGDESREPVLPSGEMGGWVPRCASLPESDPRPHRQAGRSAGRSARSPGCVTAPRRPPARALGGGAPCWTHRKVTLPRTSPLQFSRSVASESATPRSAARRASLRTPPGPRLSPPSGDRGVSRCSTRSASPADKEKRSTFTPQHEAATEYSSVGSFRGRKGHSGQFPHVASALALSWMEHRRPERPGLPRVEPGGPGRISQCPGNLKGQSRSLLSLNSSSYQRSRKTLRPR